MLRVCVCCLMIVLAGADYWTDRAKFIRDERSQAFASDVVLSSVEQKVNELLMKYKHQELDAGFKNPQTFPPAMHFFKAKPFIESSKVFDFIKRMPKGGALHGHDFSLVHTDYVIQNVTYRDNLYMCDDNGTLKFAFADPFQLDSCYKSVKVLRSESNSSVEFDAWIQSKMTLNCDNPEVKYTNTNAVWNKFNDIFATLVPLLTYQPVFEDYYYQTLQEFYDDNVKYMEIRGTLPVVYELTGWPKNPFQVLGILKDVTDKFKQDHPDFIGAKFIYAPIRHVDSDTVHEYLELYNIMKGMHPDFLIGFDLVGQEDAGLPTKDFVDVLINEDIPYFFHAGETNWNGMTSDENLIDAILLNTTRVGHGYAIVKHPSIMREIKKRGIAIEINPISNQVLKLVDDLRNHPANVLFSEDYPLVISSDDPGIWNAKGLSYDFYETFMGMMHRDDDLRTLKKFAMNSITYSALQPEEKDRAFKLWQNDWDNFILNSLDNDMDNFIIINV